jgi:hypothetical protein
VKRAIKPCLIRVSSKWFFQKRNCKRETMMMIKAITKTGAVIIAGAFLLAVAAYADSEAGGVYMGGGQSGGVFVGSGDSESGGVRNEWGIGSESGGVSPEKWGVGSESGGAAQEWGMRSESGGPLDSGAESQSGGVRARTWGNGPESDSGGVTVWGSQKPVG